MRRLGVAQALVHEPRVLIVDEPTVGLDPEERMRFRQLVTRLGQDRTILLSTHIVADLGGGCREITLLDSGSIVFHGPPKALLDQAEGRVFEITTDATGVESMETAYEIVSRTPADSGVALRAVTRDAIPEGGAPVESPTLEEAYLAFMAARGRSEAARQDDETANPSGGERRLVRKTVAIAIAEIRSARRLARTWLFAGLAVAIGMAQFLFFSFIHGTASGMSASAGLTAPRFIMSYLGMYYVWVLMVGLVFLAFDVRARDERDRIAEVVDVRPASNLSLLLGRLAGLVLVAWVPVLALAVLFQAIGGAAQLFDWPMGEMVQPVSLAVFLFLDALPVLILWCATIILLAVVLRYRLLVAAAGFALFGLHVYSTNNAPVYLMQLILPFGTAYPSDILSAYPDLTMLAHRASLLLFAAGALLLAAVLYPSAGRRIQARARRAPASSALPPGPHCSA